MPINNVQSGEVLRARPTTQDRDSFKYGQDYTFEVTTDSGGVSGDGVPNFMIGWNHQYRDWYGSEAERLI